MPSRRRRRATNAPAIAILVAPDREGMPLYRRLYLQLRDHLRAGTLRPGTALPSARRLAADLGVSRNTVEAAVSLLAAEGYVTRRVGSGTTVADPAARDAPVVGRGRRPPGAERSAAPDVPRSDLSRRGARLTAAGVRERDADRRGLPCTVDVAGFPLAIWHRLAAATTRRRGAAALHLGDPQGDPVLRRAIAEHARLTRGLHCDTDNVVIVGSTQQGLDLLARLLLDEGDVVAMENPGYPGARAVFDAAGALVAPLPVDRFGAVVEALGELPAARCAYLTPSHQFPLGTTLSLRRRSAALAWAARADGWIIEDDYDSEFRYDGRPIAALQGLDHDGRVLYLGTFNKVLFAGLRVAYLVLPPVLVDAVVSARRITDGGPPSLTQATLARFIAEGHYAAYLRRVRDAYTTRRDLLVGALAALAPRLTVGASTTGLHLVTYLADDVDDAAVARAAAGYGVGVAPLSHYYAPDTPPGEVKRGLLLSFGPSDEQEIRATVAALARALA